jgi:hypothetical protein
VIAVIGVVPVRVSPGLWSAGQHESKRGSPAVLELPGDRLQERALDAEGSDDHDCVDCGTKRHGIANHCERRCIDQHHVERLTEVVEERRKALACNKLPWSRREGSTRQKMQDTFEIRVAIRPVGRHLGSAVSLDSCFDSACRWQRELAHRTCKRLAAHRDVGETGFWAATKKRVERWPP